MSAKIENDHQSDISIDSFVWSTVENCCWLIFCLLSNWLINRFTCNSTLKLQFGDFFALFNFQIPWSTWIWHCFLSFSLNIKNAWSSNKNGWLLLIDIMVIQSKVLFNSSIHSFAQCVVSQLWHLNDPTFSEPIWPALILLSPTAFQLLYVHMRLLQTHLKLHLVTF